MKDYFSSQSKAYAAFRPRYPEELYRFIFNHLHDRSAAWDCATGNGQVAQALAPHFKTVYATDISEKQIEHAFPAPNIHYAVGKAEHTTFSDHQFDLITVAQALHWINTEAFYKEVNRVGKPGSILAVWGYALLSVTPEVDKLFMGFYQHTVGPYWDAARRLVENGYQTIPFPFEPIPAPKFQLKVEWTMDQFAGYLSSWSATQKYIRVRGQDPVIPFTRTLQRFWNPDEVKPVTFPIFMKVGRVTGK
jgi:ubiquinone/menaquinone biosynthesis C-methylase UbiE